MIKTKSLHRIIIDNILIRTTLQYNLNTNHYSITTYYPIQNKNKIKKYYDQNKNRIDEYQKEYRKQNKNKTKIYRETNKDKVKKYQKEYYEQHRDPNSTHMDSKEYRIKLSCAQQGISIEDFNGFLIDQKYCVKFNNKLKTQIRNKYNNCDYISGLHKSICNSNRELDVHHVNYDKNCGCNGNKCKLIPLSKSNHSKTNGNRQFWNRLFIYSLEYDKIYYKTTLNFL